MSRNVTFKVCPLTVMKIGLEPSFVITAEDESTVATPDGMTFEADPDENDVPRT
jgi:hypothetical protein